MKAPSTGERLQMDTQREQIRGHQGGRWRIWGERAVLIGVLAFLCVRLGPQVGALTGVGPDLGRAPDFTLVTMEGDSISSADLLGDVVLVNFWATWCGPCKLEMPSLQSLHEDLNGDGLHVLGLATDAGNSSTIESYIGERGISFPVGRATPSHRAAFGGISAVPTTILIDKDGIVRHRVTGYFMPPALRLSVSRLLREGRS